MIINSSGGITAHTELFYGRLLAQNGVAALVVDSFAPRGIRRTTTDQSQLRRSQSVADAAAGFRWLAAQPWIDASRIIVMGMSKGGIASLVAAVEGDRRLYGITDVRFAAHIAIAPACNFVNDNARTTGAPIFFMLAELDNYTPIAPRAWPTPSESETAEIKMSGSRSYPGVYHAYESTGGILEETVERSSRCNFTHTEQGLSTDRSTGRTVPPERERRYVLDTCVDQGP